MNAVLTPVLDVLQTMPSFVYLVLLTLFFSLGPAIAVALTVLYAMPPVVRIGAVGLREVSPTDDRGHRLAGPDPVAAADQGAACRWPGAR